MTIGIDIRVLAPGARTGIEEYTLNLLAYLLPLNPNIKYKLFYNAFNKAQLNYPWMTLPNIELIDFRIPNRALFAGMKYLNQPKIDQLLRGVDVYFNPHFFTAPVSRNCRKVVTFHDLSFKRYPQYFSRRKRIWQIFLIDALKEARRANKIIAVSESTKSDLINLYHLRPEKIKIIYSGVGAQFKPIGGEQKIKNDLRRKYRLPDKFILYFGTIEPRKNIIGLIKAFEIFKNYANRSELKLVLAGALGWLYKDIVKTARASKYHQDIIFTGFIEERDKLYLYNLAELFVYPSFFEGFGFPPLEAMACGLPVIVSHNSSLPEVVGDAALMVDPYRLNEIAWAMNEILTNGATRARMIKKGFSQIQKFSWQKCAEETLEVLLCE